MINGKTPDYRRFTVATKLNREELDALRRLSTAERLAAAQVVRRLIWQAAQQVNTAAASEGVRP